MLQRLKFAGLIKYVRFVDDASEDMIIHTEHGTIGEAGPAMVEEFGPDNYEREWSHYGELASSYKHIKDGTRVIYYTEGDT
jgi:hypothetical protein